MAASYGEEVRIERSPTPDDVLLDSTASVWSRLRPREVDLSPAPLGMVAEVSPYLARMTGHGELRSLELRILHNGDSLSLHLAWPDPTRDVDPSDLDGFVDAAAVMFPLVEGANPLTMGAPEQPVNMWYWRADQSGPFDVIARGYATSQRRPAATSGLRAHAAYASGRWQLVLQRALAPMAADCVELLPGGTIELALALWQGSNAERAGQKSVTPTYLSARLDP
jgi:DMSO reductase family type II enzyme heme b subunit